MTTPYIEDIKTGSAAPVNVTITEKGADTHLRIKSIKGNDLMMELVIPTVMLMGGGDDGK